MMNTSVSDCVICTEEFEGKNEMILDCGHKFHSTCVFQLFSYMDKKCPLCRYEIQLQVPDSELQTRLNNKEEELNIVLESYSLTIRHNNDLHKELDETFKVLKMTEEKISNLEFKYNIEKYKNMKTIRQLKQDNSRLLEENRKLSIGATQSEMMKKINEITKIRVKMEVLEKENEKLKQDLIINNDKNITYANNTDYILQNIQSKISELKRENTRLKSQSRRSRTSTSSSMRTRLLSIERH